MTSNFLVSSKKTIYSKIFAFSIIFAVVVPNIVLTAFPTLAFADDSAPTPVSVSTPAETVSAPAQAAPAITETAPQAPQIAPETISGGTIAPVTPVATGAPVDQVTSTTPAPSDTTGSIVNPSSGNPGSGSNSGASGSAATVPAAASSASSSSTTGTPATGSITVCKMYADTQGNLYTSSTNLPAGTFTDSIYPDTAHTGAPVATASFNSTTFAPDSALMMAPSNNAQCIVYNNLPINPPAYFYGEEVISGTASPSPWVNSYYSDEENGPIMSLYHLHTFLASDPNADGSITLTTARPNRTLVVLSRFTPPLATEGSITVCKIIVDQNGHFASTSAGLPAGNFTINLMSTVSPPVIVRTATFSASTFAPTWPSASPLDAQCTRFDHLPLDPHGYLYEPEVIQAPAGVWQTPVYNDGANLPADRPENFFQYDNSPQGNPNSDGNIILTGTIPNRILVVINKYNEQGNQTPAPGSIRVCKLISDQNNNLATSSAGLPEGLFGITLTNTNPQNLATTTINFDASNFAPNTSMFTPGQNDAQCQTINNLPITPGQTDYFYSEESITGAANGAWQTPLYNDEYNVNASSTHDFYPYVPNKSSINSDGDIELTQVRPARTLLILNKYMSRGSYLPTMPVCLGNFGTATSALNLTNVDWGYTPDDTPEHWNEVFNTDLTSGNSLDWRWIHPVGVGNYVQWDLGTSTNHLRVYAVADHGPYPQEFNEYDVQVSSDGTNWFTPNQDALYVDAMNNIRVHDGAKDFSTATSSPIQYVRVSPNGISGDDTEIDAVQNCEHSAVVNTPPTITLLGDNPFSVTIGTAFVDPGATANDTENGDLTAAIHVDGSVDTATLGSYTLTYSVYDHGTPPLGATTTRTVNVVPAGGGGGGGCTENCGTNGGGGGGGGGGQVFSQSGGRVPGFGVGGSAEPENTPQSCYYLRDYLRQGWTNDRNEVLKLQYFLIYLESNHNVQATGVFDEATFRAVSEFQTKYATDILTPWGYNQTQPTGFVYILTKKKVNEVFCNAAFPVTPGQQNEINTFRALLQGLNNGGVKLNNTSPAQNSGPTGPNAADKAAGLVGEAKPNGNGGDLAQSDNSKGQNNPRDLKALAAAIFSIPKGREQMLQSIYFLLIAIIAVYLLTEIAVGSRDNSRLSKYQIWSRKATGYLAGMILALGAAVWYQIYSDILPLVILAAASLVFLLWSISKKNKEEVIELPPSSM